VGLKRLHDFSINSKRVCSFVAAIEYNCEPGKVAELNAMDVHGFLIETAPPKGGNITLSYLDVSTNCRTLSPVRDSPSVFDGFNQGLSHTFVDRDFAYLSMHTNQPIQPTYFTRLNTFSAARTNFKAKKISPFCLARDYFQLTLNCSEVSPVLVMWSRQPMVITRARRNNVTAVTIVRILYDHWWRLYVSLGSSIALEAYSIPSNRTDGRKYSYVSILHENVDLFFLSLSP